MFHKSITFFRQIMRHIFSYIMLFVISNIAIQFILIPIFTLIGAILLRINGVQYLSNTNLIQTIISKPLLDIEILILIALIILAIYWQVTFLILGILQINSGQRLTIDTLFKRSSQRVRHTFLQTVWFLLIYTILILPFGGIGFSTPLLNKIKIPSFLIDYVFHDHPLLLLTLISIYLITFYFGIRFLLVIPLVIINRLPIRQAIKKSWSMTHSNIKNLFLLLVFTFATIFITVAIVIILLVFEQTLVDSISATWIPYTNAVFMLLLIEGTLLFSNIAIGASSIMIMLDLLKSDQDFSVHHDQLVSELIRLSNVPKNHVLTRVGVVVVILGAVVFNVLYLNGVFNSQPITVSHRGVNDANGVQNTIPSLENTSRLKPDYVEMDIHETKDRKFVVMHDENLKILTGVNKAPYQLTLKQLTRLTARENGSSAKVASFDDYFKTAHKLHQKLIIEIKTTSHDDPRLVERFNQKYSARILKYHDMIHTLNFNVVQKLKTINPKLTVGYILPFNFVGVPQSKANFYTMEYSTLNHSFLLTAQLTGKKVFAWTVNDDDQMSKMIFMGVNGIITDNLATLQNTEKQMNNHPSFSQRLINFTTEAPF
ncbi:glycerophosphoryl diester phosphodiesterase membrane domain-containing protein [Pediococcus claussenii]|uniref:Glycerophosphoryl diester phosphodiesterase family protein n=1 Tax=Pediococcus claussenii (strain ATCC BAA-344 / DSM 14800 / JCM 18046 / KCTC 3811 / LMG 21948 / P06) TaxID=701521 RepID=G8PC79_PEDCP|nr:glycerophosphodiester phosphodiesterase [Pediococcus claussenii]AEV96057.1 glycerophosphoryl diester phosphodiesterase family protein [Pediococcus claussenii ATCC BAA-344]ANZ69539.1 glycerophosphodiester phosphodiesterase [Pediococcus claussenii]ANZ71358.1 glycerophosphodiester phosphodiesterase [Pediococcus claussenii]KRN19419.1 hypothetical protein IV79_GL001471 [Pediococcus claussenii]